MDAWVWFRRAGPRVETVAVISGLGAAGGPRTRAAAGPAQRALQKLRGPAFTHTPGCDSIAHVDLNALLTHFKTHKYHFNFIEAVVDSIVQTVTHQPHQRLKTR